MDFKPVWKAVNNKFLDPEITNFNMFLCGQADSSNCTFCDKKFVETPTDLFAECLQQHEYGPCFGNYVTTIYRLMRIWPFSVCCPNCQLTNLYRTFYFVQHVLHSIPFGLFAAQLKKQFRPFSGDSSLEEFKKRLKISNFGLQSEI